MALDARMTVVLRKPFVLVRGSDNRQTDLVDAAGIATLSRTCRRAGLAWATEVEVVDGGVRGWIDLLAFDARTRRLVVVEFKTELRDLGGLQRQADLYARACIAAARSRRWNPSEVFVVVVVLATAENDAVAHAHRQLLDAALSLRGREALAAMLAYGPALGRGMLMLDPLGRGRRAFTSLRIDGRRTPAPYGGYADFAAVEQARRRARS